MYPVSSAFHSAIQAGAPQKALLLFADAVFTDTDIAARGGLTFSEPFCAQTDLTIGLCPSATLTASILNPDGVLNGYAFGEFTGYLGVRTGGGTYQPTSEANATLPINGDNVISVHNTAPYVRVGGIGVADQPAFAPQAIISHETSVYVVSAEGAFYRYTYTGSQTWGELSTLQWRDISGRTWKDIAAETWDAVAASQWQEYTNKGVRWMDYAPTIVAGEAVTVNTFMAAKGADWATEHVSAAFAGNILKLYAADGSYDTYEMCPLGVFDADRPLTRRKSVVKFTAYDRMGAFDRDVTAWWAALTFPLTLGQIFASLCTYIGVTPSTTTFLNSTHSYTTAPFTSNTLTGRAMLRYIAEAACAIARFDREGKLKLDWFGTVAHTVPEASIVSGAITLAEYNVAAIDKLQTQAETTDIGVVIGTGSNGYVLLASPLIVGETDADIRAFATPIYNRLVAFAAFTPIDVKVRADWSLQSGDIVDIIYEGNTYSLPIYTQSVAWAGDGRSTVASTGSAFRDATTVSNRETFTANQKMTLIEKSVDGLSVTVSSKTATFAQDSVPTSKAIGDTWIDTNDNNKLYRAASVGATTIAAGAWELYEIASGYVKTSHVEIAADHIDMTSGGSMSITAPTTLAITAGSGTSAVGVKNDTYFLYAGNATPADAPFSVKMDGTLKATKLSAAEGTFTKLTQTRVGGYPVVVGDYTAASRSHQGLSWGTNAANSLGVDEYGILQLRADTEIRLNTPNYATAMVGTFFVEDDVYAEGNVSAASFTDRTPDFIGDALQALATVKSDKKAGIDHGSLPEAARKKLRRKNKDARGKTVGFVEEEGRDLGMMISILTKAVQQLTAITEEQQKRLDKLDKEKE